MGMQNWCYDTVPAHLAGRGYLLQCLQTTYRSRIPESASVYPSQRPTPATADSIALKSRWRRFCAVPINQTHYSPSRHLR